MNVRKITCLQPEDHTPTSLGNSNHDERPNGDHRLIVLEGYKGIGSFHYRTGFLTGITRKWTNPKSMIEGCETEGWLTVNIAATSSNNAFLYSNSPPPTSSVTVLLGNMEMKAYLDANTEFYSLAVHQSLLFGEPANWNIDPAVLSANMTYAIAHHHKLTYLRLLNHCLYSTTNIAEFSEATTNLAIMILSAISKNQPTARKDNRLRCVKRAVEVITTHDSGTIALAELADACHCSLRTLDYAFVTHLGITPKQFLERYRLNKFRHSLISSHKYVGETAYGMGYKHLGNLAKSYNDLFGELPSVTLGTITD